VSPLVRYCSSSCSISSVLRRRDMPLVSAASRSPSRGLRQTLTEQLAQWAAILDSRGIGESDGVYGVIDAARAPNPTRGGAVARRRDPACGSVPIAPRAGGRRPRPRLDGSQGKDQVPDSRDRISELVRPNSSGGAAWNCNYGRSSRRPHTVLPVDRIRSRHEGRSVESRN
jgi:hypothetical protein